VALPIPIQRAGRIVRSGGVVAYPTESVFGLGCMPDDDDAVARVLEIKERAAGPGLVLIAAELAQLRTWIDFPADARSLSSSAERPVTWVVPATDRVPLLIRGDNEGVAIRITTHPVAAALCAAARSPLVSTSANISGRPPTRSPYVVRRLFGDLVDYVVPGSCGPARGPSEIRDLRSGKILRAAVE